MKYFKSQLTKLFLYSFQTLHTSFYEVEVTIFTNSQPSDNCSKAARFKGLGNEVTGQETINLEK